MLEIAYTMHRGRRSRVQEDSLLISSEVYQQQVLPITAQTLADGEALLAVADGVMPPLPNSWPMPMPC